MGLQTKGNIDDNPKIPEDYYVSMLDEIRHYERDDADSLGLIFNFRMDYDGEEVVLPFFAPAKLSVSEERESSRLAENLASIDRLETVLDILDDSGAVKKAVMSQTQRWIATDEDEVDELISAVNAVLAGEKIRVNVEDDQSGDESQVSKLSRVFEEESVDEDESETSDVPSK